MSIHFSLDTLIALILGLMRVGLMSVDLILGLMSVGLMSLGPMSY